MYSATAHLQWGGSVESVALKSMHEAQYDMYICTCMSEVAAPPACSLRLPRQAVCILTPLLLQSTTFRSPWYCSHTLIYGPKA